MINKIKERIKNFIYGASFSTISGYSLLCSLLLVLTMHAITEIDSFVLSISLLFVLYFPIMMIWETLLYSALNKAYNKELQEALEEYKSYSTTDNAVQCADSLVSQIKDEDLINDIMYILSDIDVSDKDESYDMYDGMLMDLLMEAEYRGLGIDLEGFEE